MNRQLVFRALWAALFMVCCLLQVSGQTFVTSLEQVETGYYRIYSQAYNATMAMSEATSTHNVFCDAPDEDDYLQVWEITVTGISDASKDITIKNVITGMKVNRSNNNFHTHANAMTFTLEYANDAFTIAVKNQATGLHHQQSGHDVVSWSKTVDASKWQIEKVTPDAGMLASQQAEYSVLNDIVNRKAAITTALLKYFNDASCAELKDTYKTYSDAQLEEAMTTDDIPLMCIDMAKKVKNNSWAVYKDGWNITEKSFRIANYKPISNSAKWANLIGVGYALAPNSDPTGIFVNADEIISIYVDKDIPTGGALLLRNVERSSASGDGYSLTKGVNVVKIRKAGLLFIDYEVDNTTGGSAPFTELSSYPSLNIHIEGGAVNGCFDITRGHTNEDWEIMKDVLFKQYDYLQLRSGKQLYNMNRDLVIAACPEKMAGLLGLWDKIVTMEHNVMGLNEFNGFFNTPLMVVSFVGEGHMFASTYGTYYNENTVAGVMNYEQMFAGGALWGPAHEIGHINQKYINMIGQTEVSNNLFSNIAIYQNGHLTSRAEYVYNTLKNMSDGVYWNLRGIWERTHLYFQLYQFFHIQGFMPDFYQKLFSALRADPLVHVKNKFIDATDDYLKFYKKACEVSGYDLTELFQAYGFFIVPTNDNEFYGDYTLDGVTKKAFKVGDYGEFYLCVTQEMIDNTIAAVKAMNLKKCNAVFIEDRISYPLASYDGHVENELKTAYDGYPIGDCGDVGQYTDFVSSNVATGYNVSYFENEGALSVLVNHNNASGAVGFKVYDAAGKLVFLSNKYNFTIPASIYSLIKNTDFTIVAAGGNGEDLIMPAGEHYIEWIVKDKAGRVFKTLRKIQFVNDVITAYPDELNAAFVTLPTFTSFTYTEPIKKEVEITCTVPFIASSESSYYYYEVKVRNGWLYESNNTPAMTTINAKTDDYRWAFFGNPYDGYRIQNKATGNWLNAGASAPEMGTDENAATAWTICTWVGNPSSFMLKNPTASKYLNDYGGHGIQIAYWSSGSQIDVAFVPTASTLVPITVDEQEGYWGTFYSSSNVALPTGVSAYRVTDVDDGTQKLTLTAVEGSVLKGGEGYIVYSTSREPGIVMESTSAAPASFIGTNYLKGSDSECEFAGEGSYYILSRKEVTEGVYNYGFFWQNGTAGNSVINAAHKAFLLVPSSSSAKSYDLSFSTTNINNVEKSADDINEPRFNLSGQRVSKNYKGIIIINGKKQIQK